jgi:hypothetical protein
MAWHDSEWDGTVCRDPAANSYCTGSHSLLSERLARNRCLKHESGKGGKPLDAAMPEYLPPCYWTFCAFARHETEVVPPASLWQVSGEEANHRNAGASFGFTWVSPVDDALAADKWRSRIAGYRAEGLTNVLVTTDDLGGVRHDRLLKVIEDIVQGTLAGDPDASFQTTITLYRYHGGHPVSTSRAEAV